MKWMIIAVFTFFSLEAGLTLYKGKIASTDTVPVYSAETHYSMGCEAVKLENWEEAASHFNIILCNFPNESFSHEAHFFLGVIYFYQGEYEEANEALTAYLNGKGSTRNFEEAIFYKLQIADKFRCGERRRCFGTKMLPKWAEGRSLALEIYEEVITALPCHDYAAISLYAKGYMLWEDQDYRGSVEAFQVLIRRFPKHELAPSAYFSICVVYLDQAEAEFHNADILALAEINLKKFQRDFPKDESLEEAKEAVQSIKESFATGLWETGQFYERTERPAAAAIYYANAIREFPDTSIASCCRSRLSVLADLCENIELCESF